MRCTKLKVLISAAICMAPALSHAQASSDAWRFEATPYLWAAGFSGSGRIGARTPTTNVDASFSDVWRNLDVGAMGSFEARKGPWAVIVDAIYVQLSKTSDPLLGGALGTVRFRVDQAILQVAGAYRVLDRQSTPVDVLAGARYTHLHGDMSFSQSRFLPSGAGRNGNVGWTDGFVGARAAYAFAEKWSLVGYADVGTGGDRLSWQVLAGVNYDISKTVAAKVGYRIISMDYEKPGFLYDVKTAGVFMGVGIRF